MYKSLCVALVLIAVVTFSFTAQADEKANPKITANSNVKAVATLTDKEAQAVSFAAGRVLQHVENARLAILHKKTDKALRQVEQGLKLVNIIENTVPKLNVTTDIKSGNISYHNEDEVAQRYVNVFNESYVEDIITPLVQAKKEGKGKQLKSKKEGEDKGKTSAEPALEDFSMWNYATVKLDVVLAKHLLEMAEKTIKDGKNADADAALLDLQTRGVIFSFTEVELPLVEATDNLKLAQLQAKSGEYAEALTTLKLASDDLKRYERITGESRSKEVRSLHQEIDKFTKSLEGEKDLKKAMENAEKEISSWTDRALKWLRNR